MLVSTVAYLLTNNIWAIAIGGSTSFLFFILSNIKLWRQIAWYGGAPNWVTGLRLLLFLGLLFGHGQLTFLQIALIATLVISADGIDGYLARRLKQASYIGSYFDRETDAFFVLAMTLLIVDKGLAGYWVLIPGLMRYLYVVVLFYFKPPEKKENKSFLGKTIAVILMISLIACFLVRKDIYLPMLMISTLLILYSFGLSFIGMTKK